LHPTLQYCSGGTTQNFAATKKMVVVRSHEVRSRLGSLTSCSRNGRCLMAVRTEWASVAGHGAAVPHRRLTPESLSFLNRVQGRFYLGFSLYTSPVSCRLLHARSELSSSLLLKPCVYFASPRLHSSQRSQNHLPNKRCPLSGHSYQPPNWLQEFRKAGSFLLGLPQWRGATDQSY
jgi:hypothetical protein